MDLFIDFFVLAIVFACGIVFIGFVLVCLYGVIETCVKKLLKRR